MCSSKRTVVFFRCINIIFQLTMFRYTSFTSLLIPPHPTSSFLINEPSICVFIYLFYFILIINIIIMFFFSLDGKYVTDKGSYQERRYLKFKGAYKQCVGCLPLPFSWRILPQKANLNCQVLDKMSSKDSKGSSDSLPTKTKKKDKTKKGRTHSSFSFFIFL